MITPENVRPETLEQTLSKLSEGNQFFAQIHNYVKAHLFSRYSERRKFAFRELNNMMRERVDGLAYVDVDTLEEDGIIYAYLSVNGEDQYTLVGRYVSEDPVFEVEPTPEERKKWTL